MKPNDSFLSWPPSNCSEIQTWLSARSDNECSPAQEGWLSEHTSACRACSEVWAELEKVRLLFETSKLVEPGDHALEAVQKALLPKLLDRLGWAAVILGALGLVGFVFTDVLNNGFTWEATAFAVLYLGLALLFFRVLCDRVKVRRTDPYRHIKR